MELQEFITGTIVQIVRGIEDASEQLKDSEAVVNPGKSKKTYSMAGGSAKSTKVKQTVSHIVGFDVAVVASHGTETKGGLGIMVGGVGLGAQGKSDAATSSESRIKFNVPLVLPHGS